jgi:hypothetical protein
MLCVACKYERNKFILEVVVNVEVISTNRVRMVSACCSVHGQIIPYGTSLLRRDVRSLFCARDYNNPPLTTSNEHPRQRPNHHRNHMICSLSQNADAQMLFFCSFVCRFVLFCCRFVLCAALLLKMAWLEKAPQCRRRGWTGDSLGRRVPSAQHGSS